MPKNIDDVIVPERKKSIRNIPIPNSRRKTLDSVPATKIDGIKKRVQEESPEVTDESSSNTVPPVPPRRFEMPPRPGASRKKVFVAGTAGLLIILFAALSIFNGATLSYAQRSVALSFSSETFTARKTADSGLLYSLVKLSGEKSVTVPASGEREVERKARGTIVVYNNATAEAQRLIENTRFESPDGKIYRIENAISIPGKSGSTPGSLEVTVYADEPGEEFNIGLVDWTVPGLKGTSRYETIYARSKTPITSGFIGVEKAVSDADLAKAEAELKTLLGEELAAKARAEVPSDFILFSSLSSIVFDDVVQTSASAANSANLTLTGNIYGVMFKKSDLARELSKNKASVSQDERVELGSYDALEIAFAGTAPSDLLSTSEVSFEVSGNTELLWVTDEASLKSDLAGRSKKDISTVLSNYPTISNASATIRPFWKSKFPAETGKITVKKLQTK